MRIAKVYLDALKAVSDGQGMPVRGVADHFLDKSLANEKTPFFLVAIPLRKAVMPVMFCVPMPDDRMYYNASVLDLSELKNMGNGHVRGWEDHAGEPFPAGGEWLRNPPKHYVALLREAQRYWMPLTAKKYAPKLLKFLNELLPDERDEMLKCIGVNATKSFLAKLFICSQWDEWARMDATPQQREEDTRKHGFAMNDAAILKMATRLGLDSIRRLRE